MVELIPSDDRGQTTQDYAVGIGLFLLAVVFVIAFIPSVLVGFDAVEATDRSAQAERIAATLVDSALVDGERVTLDGERLDVDLAALADPTNAGLSPYRSVNVTVVTIDGEETVTSGGTEYAGQSAGVWTRIVRIDDGCADGCRLVVRVW